MIIPGIMPHAVDHVVDADHATQHGLLQERLVGMIAAKQCSVQLAAQQHAPFKPCSVRNSLVIGQCSPQFQGDSWRMQAGLQTTVHTHMMAPKTFIHDPLHMMAAVAVESANLEAVVVSSEAAPSSPGQKDPGPIAAPKGKTRLKRGPNKRSGRFRKSRAKLVDPIEQARLINEMLDHLV
jgi:hypothetical protein